MTRSSARSTIARLCLATVFAAAAVSAAAPAHAAPAPPARQIVVLSNDNSGDTVHVSPGTTIVVSLKASTRTVWNAPESDTPTVVAPVVSLSLPNGDGLGVFVARAGGSANLTAVSRCRPVPGQVCNFLAILWRATVTVG